MNSNLFVKDILENDSMYSGSEDIPKYIKSLYKDTSNADIKSFFQTTHSISMRLFEHLKACNEKNKYFHAAESRELSRLKDVLKSFESNQSEFSLRPEIDFLLTKIEFLRLSGGSDIPENFHFEVPNKYKSMFVENFDQEQVVQGYKVKNFKSGSYGTTYIVKDEITKNKYILKQLKPECSEKEIKRFFVEKETLKKLSSPYIVKTYPIKQKLFKKHVIEQSYLMEYCDYTLNDYIKKNNTKIPLSLRLKIVRQLLEVVKYIHKKKILHRDLSYTNIFINEYDEIVILKLADFGLVKIENSNLTSLDSEFKGSLLDPVITQHEEGYSGYEEINEIYSVGMLINYILTGKKSLSFDTDYKYNTIIKKCVALNLDERYKSIDAIIKDLQTLS